MGVLITASNRWVLPASYLAGLALVAWILIQLVVLQRYFFLKPVIAGTGALEVLLAWAWHGPGMGRSAACCWWWRERRS